MPPSSRSVEAAWQRRGLLACLLLPFSFVFGALAAVRRLLYRFGALSVARLPVPVVVVGGITVGGSGKTPLLIALAEGLRVAGRRPGIVSRGYGGSCKDVCEVADGASAALVGDEPLLIRRRTGLPVFVGRRRVDAARTLLARHPDCNVILCDDGLQHYALARDVELVVIDRRGLGNGWRLPAGPLRESPARLAGVDAVVGHGWSEPTPFVMRLAGGDVHPLGVPNERVAAVALAGQRLHAVAGIGEPQRFFDHLAALGLDCVCHAFADHHPYVDGDLDFDGDAILTTEKDAVKFPARTRLPVWVLPITAEVQPDLAQFVLERIDGHPPA